MPVGSGVITVGVKEELVSTAVGDDALGQALGIAGADKKDFKTLAFSNRGGDFAYAGSGKAWQCRVHREGAGEDKGGDTVWNSDRQGFGCGESEGVKIADLCGFESFPGAGEMLLGARHENHG